MNGKGPSDETSVKDDSSTRPSLKRANTNVKRKDSMAAVTGFTEHLSEFLHERGADNIAGRLEALEASTKRIEDMLHKLSQNMGDDDSENSDLPYHSRPEHSNALEDEESP